jgi:glycosyltransferase involved in cell wall biosynthesis
VRIAYFTDTFLPNSDGVVTSIKLVTEHLRKNGHEVYVFCPSGIKESKYIFPITSKKYQRYPQYKISFPSFKIFTKIREINPDIIHVHTPVTIGLTGLYLGKILNIPTVLTYHTRLDSYMWYIRSKEDKGFIEQFTSWLYNQSPTIIPSKSIEKLLKDSKVTSQITVLPNPVNLKLVGKKQQNPFPIILHVGRICREKQIDIILRAFKKTLQVVDANLIITSSGPDEDRLKRYTKGLKLDDKVSFTGRLSINQLREIYSKADVFVAASNTETQGLVILEAMANGCSVIARKAPGFIDVIKDGKNGLLFDYEGELAEKITELILDEQKRAELVRNGFKTVEGYHPDKLVARLEGFYTFNLHQPREPTVERILYASGLMFSFIIYEFVRSLDLPINSRLANVSIDMLKLFLRIAKLLRL